ncbi:MAG: histidine phosphatase family protein [Candidatus Melainabacteria bacterium]|nr:histidine phosphatase family protein [Candidatus Melainabacteria bacterium]
MVLPREFYFVRHGQTEHNLSQEKTDQGDISLNETGLNQARQIAPLIASLSIQTICFSPFKRAKETKDILSKKITAPQQEILHLGECGTGVWDEMTSLGPDAQHLANEPVKTFMQNALAGINQALAKPGPVLIVSHGGVHWAMCCFMKVDHEWAIENCVPIHFSFSNEGKWVAKKLTPSFV